MKVPWTRLGGLFAVVTLGGSQCFFHLVARHPAYFPTGLAFHAWALLWVQVVPFALFFGLDSVVVRGAGEGSRGYAFWRSFVYALAATLFARQLQVLLPGPFFAVVPSWAALPSFALVFASVFALSAWRRGECDRLAGILGLLALLVTAGHLRNAAAGERTLAGPPTPGPPIVILLFDELGLDVTLKDGRIDRERFPRLAALADEGAWFPDATSNSWFTVDSISAMLSGRRTPAEDGPIFFDYLKDTHRATVLMAWPGYSAWFLNRALPGDRIFNRIEPDALGLGPLDTAFYLGSALEESPYFRRSFTRKTGERLATPDLWDYWQTREPLRAEVDSFLHLIRKSAGKGRILYWHSMLPHAPFSYGPDGHPHGRPHTRFMPGAPHPEKILENYGEQARATDGMLGRVIDLLKAQGLYDETLLVVTGDHGLRTWGAMEAPGFPDTRDGRALRIPMLLRGPSVRPGVYPADYQNMDFVPTLLDVLGRPAPPGAFDGRSAFEEEPAPREKVFWKGPVEHVLDRASGLWRRRK